MAHENGDNGNGKNGNGNILSRMSTAIVTVITAGIITSFIYAVASMGAEITRLKQRVDDYEKQHDIEIADIKEKLKEIVPRSENERRYESIETRLTRDEEHENYLDRVVYSLGSNGKIPLNPTAYEVH